ncbi:MAG: hypothetical protein IT486_02745 [Gammaproteobacteria bacterium]|nr:hypothetical protein [Gammaproteobacteria bacterium]
MKFPMRFLLASLAACAAPGLAPAAVLLDECSDMQPGWVFCSSFQEGTKAIWDDFDGNPDSTNRLIADSGPFGLAGNTVMQFIPPAGRTTVDLIKVLPSTYDSLYARWYIKYEPGFDLGARNHGGGLHAGQRGLLGHSGVRPNGSDWYTAWIDYSLSSPHRHHIYTYYAGMDFDCADPNGRCWGDIFPYPNNPVPAIETDRWYCVELYMNGGTPTPTSTGASGQLDFWVDGVHAGPFNNLWMRTTANLKINILWLSLFHHGEHSTAGIRYDNVVVSQNRIGCPQVVDCPNCPAPPTNLTVQPGS